MAMLEFEQGLMSDEERRGVASAMSVYGGSFIHALAEALFRADPISAAIIKDGWYQLWCKYYEIYNKEMMKK